MSTLGQVTASVSAYRVAAVIGVVVLGATGPGWMAGAAFAACCTIALRLV